jgi:hypothetical protein
MERSKHSVSVEPLCAPYHARIGTEQWSSWHTDAKPFTTLGELQPLEDPDFSQHMIPHLLGTG